MTRYILGRVIQMVPVLFGVLLLVFSITNIIPGDPVLLMLDVKYSEKEYKEMQAYLGLDKPLYIQFYNHVKGVLKGNLGKSIRTREPVTKKILERFPSTFVLALAAMLIVVIVSIPVGVIAALKQNSKIDYICMIGAEIGISMPIFWLGIMMILLFSLYLGWLPAGGRGEPPDLLHLILPAFCLATPYEPWAAARQAAGRRIGDRSGLPVAGHGSARVRRHHGERLSGAHGRGTDRCSDFYPGQPRGGSLVHLLRSTHTVRHEKGMRKRREFIGTI